MRFTPALKQGVFLRRYKRFLADVVLDGVELTVHCANTGSMKNCIVEGSPCWLWDSQNSRRKYRFTWELATTTTGHLAGINTARANQLVVEAIGLGAIGELNAYDSLRREVKYGDNSRIDILLSAARSRCYVEVKSVTLGVGGGLGLFPDATSKRAARHLSELVKMKAQGHRAVLLFCVQHSGIDRVAPADDIDPVYAAALRSAVRAGVEVIAYRASVGSLESCLENAVPVIV